MPLIHMFAFILALTAPPVATLVLTSDVHYGTEEHRQAVAAQIEIAVAQLHLAGPAVPEWQRPGNTVQLTDVVSGRNCALGRLLPEFYVLGAMNTATTSLFLDLQSSGATPAPGTMFDIKEWHFFQEFSCSAVSVQWAVWESALLECPPTPTVMGDFSVSNLYTIPLPSDLAWSQAHVFPDRAICQDNFHTPELIRQFHAKAGGATPRFVVLFRNPLERLQSEWYHTVTAPTCTGCIADSTFTGALAANVALLQRQPPMVSDWTWKSFYARQVEEYLKYFDARHFFFVPDKEYFALNPPNFSASILKFLDIDSGPWTEASHANVHANRPPLDEDLPPGEPTRVAYETLMAPENARLVRTLAEAQLQGAVLANYEGPPGDVAAIGRWLERGW